MYMETTHGKYDGLAKLLNRNKSIRPMNVHAEYWKELGYSREDLGDPGKNIAAGTTLIKRIINNMPDASVAQIATVYNYLGATRVSDYGARVEQIFREKLWEK
jgi:hypothetical protein